MICEKSSELRFALLAKKKSTDQESNEINNKVEIPKVKRTKKPKSIADGTGETPTVNPKIMKTKKLSANIESITSTTGITASEQFSEPVKSTESLTTEINSFDNEFAELEKSLKKFDLDDIDDVDGNTLRSIESGEFDIDALMSMDGMDMSMPSEHDGLDHAEDVIDSMDFEDVLKSIDAMDADAEALRQISEESSSGKQKTKRKGKVAAKVIKKANEISDELLGSDDDISSSDVVGGEDEDVLSLLESKESTESDLFDNDDENEESEDELADFDFSAISKADDDDDDDEDIDDDQDDDEGSSRKTKRRTKSSEKPPAIDETLLDDENIDIDESMMNFGFTSYSREEELAPSTIAAASGFAVSGQFSSKEKATALASASAATRAASAKRKKELVASGMTVKAATKSLKKEQEALADKSPMGIASVPPPDEDKLMIDGFEVDKMLGTPPPLEEFRRLMESLGAESGLFDDENAERAEGIEMSEAQKIRKLQREYRIRKERERLSMPVYNQEEKLWTTRRYEGGHPDESRGGNRTDVDDDDGILSALNLTEAEVSMSVDEQFNEHTIPYHFRVVVVAHITSVPEGERYVAKEVATRVIDHIVNATNHDPRIQCKIMEGTDEDQNPFEAHADVLHMWVESYNTYHLIDGVAMKAAWGGIMPDIILSETNLAAMANQVKQYIDWYMLRKFVFFWLNVCNTVILFVRFVGLWRRA